MLVKESVAACAHNKENSKIENKSSSRVFISDFWKGHSKGPVRSGRLDGNSDKRAHLAEFKLKFPTGAVLGNKKQPKTTYRSITDCH